MTLLNNLGQSFALAGAVALGAALGVPACTLNRSGTAGPRPDAAADGGGGEGGVMNEGGMTADGGMGGDGGVGEGGMGEGGMGPDPSWTPTLARPLMGITLPPTYAYLLWQDGVVPMGLTVTGYEVCWTTGGMETIDGETECPNSVSTTRRRHTLGLLLPGQTVLWKVGTNLSDGSTTLHSGVWSFSTDSSLVGWWPLDEGAGATAGDSSGLGNNGTLQGSPTWVAGIAGSALLFDGTNYVRIGDQASLEGMSQVTVEAWIQTESPALNRVVFSKWYAGSRSYALRFSDPSVGLARWATLGTGETNSESTSLLNGVPAAWRHVMGTYDGATQRLYVDTVLEDSDAQTGAIAMSDKWVCIADFCDAAGVGQGFGFVGIIDGLAVYTVALSPEARLNSYCATLDLSGLVSLPDACQP